MRHKSTYSTTAECIEVEDQQDGRTPRRSAGNGACVHVSSGVLVRDTKLENSPVLHVCPRDWARFLASLR